MSGQWEVVGRKKGKDQSAPSKKSVTTNGKKNANIPFTPKIEDVLPLKQVKNLYNKETRKPQPNEKVASNTGKHTGKAPSNNANNKKPQQDNNKQNEGAQTAPKIKSPKTIESALKAIDPEEFSSILDLKKNLFPDAPIVWLKFLVQFLNQKVSIDVQDTTFSNKPDMYPLSVMPSQLKAIIERSIVEAGENNAHLFFDISLTSMATDMSKNLSTLGHKFYLQYLAIKYSHYVSSNLNKYLSLRTSYQNRQNIGLSILWALGQVGLDDLQAGLEVFQEIFLPLIEMKNYSRYVIQYLIDLINRHEKRKDSLSVEQYLLVLDVTYANYKNFPNDLKSELAKMSIKLDGMVLSGTSKDKQSSLVEPLLKKIQSNANSKYKTQLSKVLVSCLQNDKKALTGWSKCYAKNVQQTAALLQYIDQNWSSLSGSFNNPTFSDLLASFAVANEELKTKRKKETGLDLSIASIKSLTIKMAPKKCSRFSLCNLSTLLLFAAVVLCYYDIASNGSYEKSQTGKFVNSHPALKDGLETSLKTLNQSLQWAHVQVDQLVPGYYEKTTEYLKPYCKLSGDLKLIVLDVAENVKQAAIAQVPVVRASIESYAPGMIDQSHQAVSDAWAASLVAFNQSVVYLKTEVFVGQLAPENVQRVVWEALNTTQQKASEYYYWLYEKVQSSIK